MEKRVKSVLLGSIGRTAALFVPKRAMCLSPPPGGLLVGPPRAGGAPSRPGPPGAPGAPGGRPAGPTPGPGRTFVRDAKPHLDGPDRPVPTSFGRLTAPKTGLPAVGPRRTVRAVWFAKF